MESNEFRADMIEVLEKGTFKTEHTFRSGAEVLGVLHLRSSRAEGVFQGYEGATENLKRTSIWKSNYEWQRGNRAVALAGPRGKLSRALIINYEGDSFGLLPGGSKLRSWVLKNVQNTVLCEFQPRGAFKRGALIRIMSQVPLSLLAFSYCLVSKRWQESSST